MVIDGDLMGFNVFFTCFNGILLQNTIWISWSWYGIDMDLKLISYKVGLPVMFVGLQPVWK